MQQSRWLPPSETKPLRHRYILISAATAAVLNIVNTLNATSDGMIWQMAGDLPTALSWLAVLWMGTSAGIWGFLLLAGVLNQRVTTWRSLMVIVAIGTPPSLILALLTPK